MALLAFALSFAWADIAWAQHNNGTLPFQWFEGPGQWYQTFRALGDELDSFEVFADSRDATVALPIQIRSADLRSLVAHGKIQPNKTGRGWQRVVWDDPVSLRLLGDYAVVIGSWRSTGWRIGYSPVSYYPWGHMPEYQYSLRDELRRFSDSKSLRDGGGDLAVRAVYTNGGIWPSEIDAKFRAPVNPFAGFEIPKCRGRVCGPDLPGDPIVEYNQCAPGVLLRDAFGESASCDDACKAHGLGQCLQAKATNVCGVPFGLDTTCDQQNSKDTVCVCGQPAPASSISDRWVVVDGQISLRPQATWQDESCGEVCSVAGLVNKQDYTRRGRCRCRQSRGNEGITRVPQSDYIIRKSTDGIEVLDAVSLTTRAISLPQFERASRNYNRKLFHLGRWRVQFEEEVLFTDLESGKSSKLPKPCRQPTVVWRKDEPWLACVRSRQVEVRSLLSQEVLVSPDTPESEIGSKLAVFMTDDAVHLLGVTKRWSWANGTDTWKARGETFRISEAFINPEVGKLLSALAPGTLPGLGVETYALGSRVLNLKSQSTQTLPKDAGSFENDGRTYGAYIRDSDGIYRFSGLPKSTVWVGKRAFFGASKCPKEMTCQPVPEPFHDIVYLDLDPDTLSKDWWLKPETYKDLRKPSRAVR